MTLVSRNQRLSEIPPLLQSIQLISPFIYIQLIFRAFSFLPSLCIHLSIHNLHLLSVYSFIPDLFVVILIYLSNANRLVKRMKND